MPKLYSNVLSTTTASADFMGFGAAWNGVCPYTAELSERHLKIKCRCCQVFFQSFSATLCPLLNMIAAVTCENLHRCFSRLTLARFKLLFRSLRGMFIIFYEVPCSVDGCSHRTTAIGKASCCMP